MRGRFGMLRIAKVRQGAERYYFGTVRSTTDRPEGLVEPDPYWLGRGCEALGLIATPVPSEVRAVCTGRHPSTGERLRRQAARTGAVAGFDVVLSAPKSVSLLCGLGDPAVSRRVESAHRAAVEATIGYLEEQIARTRRRRAGVVSTLALDGVVAACFPHRTSRPNDPHLHAHVLIANLAQAADGQWGALDGRRIYRAQRPLRALFEAQLRWELSRGGVAFGPVRRDYAEVVGVSRAAVREFSRQSRIIEAALRAEGLRGPAAHTVVAEALRPPKDRSRPYDALRQEWLERGHRLGLSASRVAEAAGGRAEGHGGADGRIPRGDLSWLTGAGWVDGTFDRDALLVARASSLRGGAPIEQIAGDVDKVLASAAVAKVGERFTTPAHLRSARAAAAQFAEQLRLTGAELLCYGPRQRLGALDAAARLAGGAGRVVALAPGGRAARGFESATGIETFPVARVSELAGSLVTGDRLVLADAGRMLHDEVASALGACAATGASAVLLAGRSSLECSLLFERVLEQARPLEPGSGRPARATAGRTQLGDRVEVRLVADASSACEEVLELAGTGADRPPVVAVADRALAAALAARCPVVDARRVGSELAGSGRDGVRRLVVVGGVAPLEVSPAMLERVERTHVLVAPTGATLGRLLEAVRPPSLAAALGRPPVDPSGRAAWRDRAERTWFSGHHLGDAGAPPLVLRAERIAGGREEATRSTGLERRGPGRDAPGRGALGR